MPARLPARAGVLGRLAVLLLAGTLAAACGGFGTAGTGRIAGSVSVSVNPSTAAMQPRSLGAASAPRVAPMGAPRFVPDELLVKFNPGASLQAADLHRRVGVTEVAQLLKGEIRLVRLAPGQALAAVQAAYRSDPRVAFAEPNYYRYSDAATPSQVVPNDTLYPDQWNFRRINAAAAWDVSRGSSLVVVAAIDKGVLPHEDLSGVFVGGHDFTDNSDSPTPKCSAPAEQGHGTAVASIIAAVTNNTRGVAGLNWGGSGGTKIMPLQIFSETGGICATTSARIVAAIQWAADHSARVINMSFGGQPGDPLVEAEQAAVNYAHNAGVTIVASAGNHGVEICTAQVGRWPVGYNNVIGVAATTQTDTRASYSNYGQCIDVAAPGGESNAAIPTASGTIASPNQYLNLAGTSFAAPHVAGLAALLIAKGVTSPGTIESILESTAQNLGPGLGAGLINAGSALGAPSPTHPMRVFGGTLSGNVITPVSAMVPVSSSGAYSLTIPAGTWTVFAWQDFNGSNLIDVGDMYGAAPGVSVGAGATTSGVNVSVAEVAPGTPPRTVGGSSP